MTCKPGSLKVGDIVMVTVCNNGHNYTVGKTYVVVDFYNDHVFRAKDPQTGVIGNYIRCDEVVKACTHREHFNDLLKEREDAVADIRAKLAWMDEIGTDEFDETEYKVWSIMNAVDDRSMTKIERVKLIASLVKG